MSKILSKLYDYQQDTVKKCLSSSKGIINLPTGTGKSYIISAYIAAKIEMNKIIGLNEKYLINVPRILLSYQLMKDIYSFLVDLNIEARYFFYHSGGRVDEEELEKIRAEATDKGSEVPYSQIGSGTSKQELVDFIAKAESLELPLIILSTYHSADKLSWVQFDSILNDEAHFLVQEEFHNIISKVQGKSKLYFTATSRHTPSVDGLGMNNKDKYGDIIASMSPREAINKGVMVRPRLHIVTTKEVASEEEYKNSMPSIIKNAFIQHRSTIDINPKLLVSIGGTKYMSDFIASKEYEELSNIGVDIFIISSNQEIGARINNVQYTRPQFLKLLKEYGEDTKKQMLVIHYDIIAEGISVNGFTGILPLRNLNKAKFLQTYGRAARLDPLDRKRLREGTLNAHDLDDFVKPYAYVILPNIIKDDVQHFTNVIHNMRLYDFDPFEYIISTSKSKGIIEQELLENLNQVAKKNKTLASVITNFDKIIEEESVAKLAPPSLLDELFIDK